MDISSLLDRVTERPGNVSLADKFSAIFCDFSIGGPGLARLALGIGRNGGLADVKRGLEVNRIAELPRQRLPGRRVPGHLLQLLRRWTRPHAVSARPRPRRRG